MFMILALVVTTTMTPSVSRAMPHDDAKVEKTQQASKDHDCHGHGEKKTASEKTAQNDKNSSGKCCDGGVCKCVGGTCHNGLSQFLGNGSNSLATVSSSSAVFAFDNQFVDSAFSNRIKRPPRA